MYNLDFKSIKSLTLTLTLTLWLAMTQCWTFAKRKNGQRTTNDCKIEIVTRFDTYHFFIESSETIKDNHYMYVYVYFKANIYK
jgi:hypothetical protein